MLKRITTVLLILALLCACAAAQAAGTKTLRKGSRGNEVKALQTELQKLGLYTKKIDGIYGKGTVAAVKAYQRKNGLRADGIAGPKTLGKLYANGTPAAASEPAASAGEIPTEKTKPGML